MNAPLRLAPLLARTLPCAAVLLGSSLAAAQDAPPPPPAITEPLPPLQAPPPQPPQPTPPTPQPPPSATQPPAPPPYAPQAQPPAPSPAADAEREADAPAATGPFAPAPGAKGKRDGFYFQIRPFVTLVGGAKYDNAIQPDTTTRNDRLSAIMLADFGVRGEVSDWVSFESEIMANGGPRLHGTSVYDGQAALQVRKQVIHLGKGRWSAELGRVVDEASVDYFSGHVADTLMQDTATRDPLLFSGFNLGNGVRGTFEVLPGLRIGIAGNAGNPTASSAILTLGGAFPPYDRIYFQAAQRTRQDLNGYPDDQFHSYVLTPSAMYSNKYFEARSAFQMFLVDVNANDNVARNLRGYNYRLNLRGHLFGDVISPFVNFSYGRNDVVDPTNVTRLSPDKYTGIAWGAGVDVNYQRRFGNQNGVGIQYVNNQYKVGDGVLTTNQYLNIGTTYWLTKYLAAGARFALWSFDQKGQNENGERSVLVTMRLTL